jgi:hypothetical protein
MATTLSPIPGRNAGSCVGVVARDYTGYGHTKLALAVYADSGTRQSNSRRKFLAKTSVNSQQNILITIRRS